MNNEFSRAARAASAASDNGSLASRDRALRGALGVSGSASFNSRKFAALHPQVQAHVRSGISISEAQIVDAVYRGVEQSRGQPVTLSAAGVAKSLHFTSIQADGLIRGLVQKGHLIPVTSTNSAAIKYTTKLQGDAQPTLGLRSALGVKTPAKREVPAVPAFVHASPVGSPAIGGPSKTSGNALVDIIGALAQAVNALQAQLVDGGAAAAASGTPGTTKETKSKAATRITAIAGVPITDGSNQFPLQRSAADLAPRIRRRMVANDPTRK